MELDGLIQLLGVAVVASPTILLLAVGGSSLIGYPLSERAMTLWTQVMVVSGLLAALGMLAFMLMGDTRHVPIELGHWVILPEEQFHFHLKFIFDRLSVPFVILCYLLVGTTGAFASRYLHREKGFGRFFNFYALFLWGMVVSSLAGTIETLFAGWEVVGLSSALLVAFFHERTAPVRNGLRVWCIYRISDAAFLIAAISLHHLTSAGDLEALMGHGVWPQGQASLPPGTALFVGALLLVAAAGKSALIPFSGWLPRAMEGPTPSSAIFYGALSVHLGAYLLLRVSPVLEQSPLLCAAVVILGLLTAIYAAVTAPVQTDIKSGLAFASLVQVGLIVAEIGLGFRYLPLIHIMGHACLRTLQLLRAPSLLQDYHVLENAIGGHLPVTKGIWQQWLPAGLRRRLYRAALERGYLDQLADQYVVHPFTKLFRWCDDQERRWTSWLSGSKPPDPPAPSAAHRRGDAA